MTELLEENGTVACGDAPHAEPKTAIRVKLDCSEERVIEVEQGACVATILEVVATERGCGIEELILTREGEDAPLALGVAVDANYPRTRRHHVHYPGDVKVTVYYQAGENSREFKRFEAVKDVLAWAILAFKIDSSLATEFVLTRTGQRDELPEREYIGHLAGKDSDLALDLVRGDIANGCSR